MPDNIQKIKNKNLREEFQNHPIYSDKNDLDFYKENEENYDNKPYFVQSGPSIAAGAPSMYGYQELEYPRIGFYTLMPGKNPNPKHKYLEQYYGKPTLYRWTKGEGFLNSKHYPEVTSPGDDNYPRIVNEFVTLSNMAGVPTFVGQSPEISKQLNELVVTPKYKYFIIKNKNGGTMKKLITKHQYGNPIVPESQRTMVKSEVNQTGVPRVNPLYNQQHISPAVNKTGETGYLRITPEGFGAYTEEFVPKSDTEYYNIVQNLYNKGKLLNSPESTLPRLNEYTESPAHINSKLFKLLQKFKTKEKFRDNINGYKKYQFKADIINNI